MSVSEICSARYLDPTILYPISWCDRIMEGEIFGPLLSILTYSDPGALIGKIKSMPKILAGYVFCRNQKGIDCDLQSLFFGGGAVNQTKCFTPSTALISFGAVRKQGIEDNVAGRRKGNSKRTLESIDRT